MCEQKEEEIKGSYYLIFLIAYVVVTVCITIISTFRLLAISRRQSKAIAAIGKVTSKTANSLGGSKVTDLQGTNASATNADCRGTGDYDQDTAHSKQKSLLDHLSLERCRLCLLDASHHLLRAGLWWCYGATHLKEFYDDPYHVNNMVALPGLPYHQ